MTKFVLVVGVVTTLALGGTAYVSSNSSKSKEPTSVTETTTSVVSFKSEEDAEPKLASAKAVTLGANTVWFDGVVNTETMDEVIASLETIRLQGYSDAMLVINSPGGSVLAGAELISYMESSSLKVNTFCRLICASMGFHILQAGKTRYALPTSVIMAHPASGGTMGTIENMKAQIDMIKLLVDRLDAKAAKRAGVPYKEFKARVADNIWIDGVDAKSQKFVDELGILQYGDVVQDSIPALDEEKTSGGENYKHLFDIK